MNTKGSVTVVFLCFLTLFYSTDCKTCQKNILEGDNFIFTVVDRPLKDDDRLSVFKDGLTILLKKTKKNIDIKRWSVKNKDLELQHVTLNDSGTYKIDVLQNDGSGLKSPSQSICVLAKVPKPTVNITCQDEKINFRCDVQNDKDLSYSWNKNGKEIKIVVSNVLTNIDPDNLNYTCTARNPVHQNTSDPVKATCFKPLMLFGFDFWIMVSILAGGGALVLILTIVLVTCACRACKRGEKQQRDEEEYRLNYLNTSSHHGQQVPKQTARGQPAPPEPYDNVSAQDIPCQAEQKPRNQPRARPPPPPVDDEEEMPPPLPQPRKTAQHKKRERPM